LAGRLFHLAARILVPGVSDTQCGFKLYTFRAAKAIFSRARINRFAYEVEALWLARRMGYKIVEIGVLWVHDPDSRIRVVRDGMRMLIDVISIPIIHWRAWNEKVFEYR
jgi:dolichyl-phosphate beta-glucosyltransferase